MMQGKFLNRTYDEILRQKQNALSLSQIEFSEKLHIATSYYNSILKRNKIPSDNFIELLFSTFDFSDEEKTELRLAISYEKADEEIKRYLNDFSSDKIKPNSKMIVNNTVTDGEYCLLSRSEYTRIYSELDNANHSAFFYPLAINEPDIPRNSILIYEKCSVYDVKIEDFICLLFDSILFVGKLTYAEGNEITINSSDGISIKNTFDLSDIFFKGKIVKYIIEGRL